MWEAVGWDEKSWDEVRWEEITWSEIWDEMKCGVWSVKSAVWSVRKVFPWRCIAPGSCAGHVLVVVIYQVLIIYIPIPHLFKRFGWSERIVIITTWYGLCIIPQTSPIWVVYQVFQVAVIYQILIIYIPTPHLFKRFDWSRMDCDHHHFGLCIIPQVSPIWVVYQVVVIYHEYHHQSLDEASDPAKSYTTPLGRFESTSWSWCGKRWEIRSNCPRCAVTKSGWVLAKKSMGVSYGNMGIKPGRRACAGLIYSGWWLGTMEFYDCLFSWE